MEFRTAGLYSRRVTFAYEVRPTVFIRENDGGVAKQGQELQGGEIKTAAPVRFAITRQLYAWCDLLPREGKMQTFKTHNFVSDWGFHLVMLAITLPVLGLAYLAWTTLPTVMARDTEPLPLEEAQRNARDVIVVFHEAGLTAEVVHGATKDERDGLSSLVVADTIRFRLSDEDKETGTVFCFKNKRDLERMKNYYEALNQSLPQFRSWLYVKDNILLQVNHEVPESKASTYAAALDTLDQ